MCNVCLRMECPPGCPNYEPHYTGEKCYFCGQDIFFGDTVIENINGEKCHYECAENTHLYEFARWCSAEVKVEKEEEKEEWRLNTY